MAGSGLPQLNVSDFEPQVIWLVVLFFIFYLIIRNRVSPYFYSETENRDSFVKNNYSEAKKLQQMADHLAQEYSEKIQGLHSRASEVVSEAQQNAYSRIEQEKNKLSQQFNKDMEEFSKTLDERVSSIENSLDVMLADLKNSAAEKLGLKGIKSVNDNHIIDKTKVGGA